MDHYKNYEDINQNNPSLADSQIITQPEPVIETLNVITQVNKTRDTTSQELQHEGGGRESLKRHS